MVGGTVCLVVVFGGIVSLASELVLGVDSVEDGMESRLGGKRWDLGLKLLD